MAKQRHRLNTLARKIGDPYGPAHAEMMGAMRRLTIRAREWLGASIAAATAGAPMPARTQTEQDEADARVRANWNRRHGVVTLGAREELRRRIARIALVRRETAAWERRRD